MTGQHSHRTSVLEAHDIYSKYHRHFEEHDSSEDLGGRDHKPAPSFPMFHRVMKTGVIYATSRASKHGFSPDNLEWANMGQGA